MCLLESSCICMLETTCKNEKLSDKHIAWGSFSTSYSVRSRNEKNDNKIIIIIIKQYL